MRFSSILTSIKEALNHRQGPGAFTMRGRTTNATLTELFIDGQPSRRIVPSTDSSVMLCIRGVAHYGNGTTLFTDSTHLFRVSAVGVITQVDLDGTTAATQGVETAAAVLAPSGAAVPKLSVMALGAANGFTLAVVAATATSPAYISLSVTGLASVNIDWEFDVKYIEAGPRG
jgi:hypothetical protein